MDVVGRQTRRCADGIVVNEFDVGLMQVPIVLSLVEHVGCASYVWCELCMVEKWFVLCAEGVLQ